MVGGTGKKPEVVMLVTSDEGQRTQNVQKSRLAHHGFRVELAHVRPGRKDAAGAHLQTLQSSPCITFHDVFDMECPLLMVVMGDPKPGIVGDDVGVHAEQSADVRLCSQPCYLHT